MIPDGLEEHFYFGGGGETNITPVAICILVLASLALGSLSCRMAPAIYFRTIAVVVTIWAQRSIQNNT